MRGFRREVELRGDDVFGNFVRELALFAKPRPLRGGRAGNDDYRGKMALGVRLVEQRNIGAEPVITARRTSGLLHPAVANDGMEDALKLTPFYRIGKDNLTQADSVWLAIRIGYTGPEGFDYGCLDVCIASEQLMHTAIGVEKFGRKMAA